MLLPFKLKLQVQISQLDSSSEGKGIFTADSFEQKQKSLHPTPACRHGQVILAHVLQPEHGCGTISGSFGKLLKVGISKPDPFSWVYPKSVGSVSAALSKKGESSQVWVWSSARLMFSLISSEQHGSSVSFLFFECRKSLVRSSLKLTHVLYFVDSTWTVGPETFLQLQAYHYPSCLFQSP